MEACHPQHAWSDESSMAWDPDDSHVPSGPLEHAPRRPPLPSLDAIEYLSDSSSSDNILDTAIRRRRPTTTTAFDDDTHHTTQPIRLPYSMVPFIGGFRCEWSGCTRSTVFRREADVLGHIRTIHLPDYRCPDDGSGQAPGGEGHLNRHFERRHSDPLAERRLMGDEPGRERAQARSATWFTSTWELPYVLDGIPENERLRFVLDSITLTMSERGVIVQTCNEFIQGRYGRAGVDLLAGLLTAVGSDDGRYTSLDIRARCSKNDVSVSLAESFTILQGMLVWLSLTFRPPKKDTICFSTGNIDSTGLTLQGLSPAASNGASCWFGLFESAVVAVDPHIQTSQTRYLETNFALLLYLAAVEYPVLFDGGLVLMGYSTALVPVRRIDDETTLWHLETADHDSQLKMSSLKALRGDWLKVTELRGLGTKKALLGWCPEAITLLGTGQLDTVEWSNAKAKRSSWAWTGANLQFIAASAAPFQLGGQAGLTFDRSINTLRFSAERNYFKCLSSSAKEQIVIYDVECSRAWLVPLICVFHEMLRAYWRTVPSQFRQADIPAASPSFDGASAALAALWNSGGTVVAISPDDRLTIRDLILGFSTNLSRAVLHRPNRKEIYGYEVMDLTMDSSKSDLKRCHIKKQGLPWITLLEQVNCLFCSKLGEAIHGSRGDTYDSPCNQVPEGRDWLVATMRSINELNARHGGHCLPGIRRLSDQHQWLMTGSPFEKCGHPNGGQASCWESGALIQEIQTTRGRKAQQYDKDPLYSENGAVVFGRPTGFPISLCQIPGLSMKNKQSVPGYSSQSSVIASLPISSQGQHDVIMTMPSNVV
ncbi:uncharacterized protein DSM5745_00969 [Aspergillus mulundensis]|uniref:Spondin domain-containing protein n=1 Tax=Aspergillus mulundensis TaxID=1810919 RepID=A0A3D8T505_9EURO|nr:hypothetical protein DSM5745_00969 [Aspergillus mulundensis]RDW93647.1 hypothetical protein DSM5745_00969 [Aspergillus mulundensis]